MAMTEQEYAAWYTALPAAEREVAERASDEEIKTTISNFRAVTRAVAQTGRDAFAKGDITQARVHFNSLKACGAALADADHLMLIQLVGKALEEMADTELAKIE
jgi:hypothetical protein